MSTISSIRASTIALASVGAITTGIIAYAVYFDHKRRTDPEFRKALKRESRKEARAAKEEAEAHGAQQKEAIKNAVDEAREEGFPTNTEDKETYFMNEVGRGEALCQDGSDQIEAALCFYKALKVYPAPGDLMSIYDKTVPKPVLDILAEMIASDPSFPVGPGASRGPSSESGIDG
ncbi:MAG: hypothetical protein HETSPECPRED_006781 [Heterodermia speciosa]|uniref:Mitochondrial import receptor subunit TOM20 n=1 Tax=Heterodermia speciosa TaxID=116794 RepID=A0A8H3IQY5_9LECA|nr:MAG: hypothetical protein HETSPECPRED_006781 [Heterodermia speciosa]